MPAADPNSIYAAPLTLDERRIILEALTTGGRSQRAVAGDPNIRGTHDQIRAVVREALRDDPSLRDHFPHLRGRPVADVTVLAAVHPDGTQVEHRAAEMLAAAGVDVAGLRIRSITMRVGTRVHVLRDRDGTFSPVSVRVPDLRIEWVADGTAATASQPAVPPSALTIPAPRTTAGGPPWRLSVAAMTWLILLLLVLSAVVFQAVETPVAPGEAPRLMTPGAVPSTPQ